jgi:hypothetical protein
VSHSVGPATAEAGRRATGAWYAKWLRGLSTSGGPWAGLSSEVSCRGRSPWDTLASIPEDGRLQGSPARLPWTRSTPCGAGPAPSGPCPLAGASPGAGRSASRPCSTDESVTFQHRCQSWNALSFHGLCSPPRSLPVRSALAVPRGVPISRPGRLASPFAPDPSSVLVVRPRGSLRAGARWPSSEYVRSGGCAFCPFSASLRVDAARGGEVVRDLHGVLDVKERSEERLLGQSPAARLDFRIKAGSGPPTFTLAS